jgi:hypothetical protein
VDGSATPTSATRTPGNRGRELPVHHRREQLVAAFVRGRRKAFIRLDLLDRDVARRSSLWGLPEALHHDVVSL